MNFHVLPICNLYYLPKIQYFKINCPKQSSVSLITVHGTKSVRILYLTTAELWGVCSLGLFTVEAFGSVSAV